MNTGSVVLTNPQHSGFPYGMQRDLETEIVRLTGGRLHPVPDRGLPALVNRYVQPCTRYASLGRLVPKKVIDDLSAETLWMVLMGPEDFPFWFHRGWDRNVDRVVLYLFDTFEVQLPTIRRMLASGRFDVLVTSFPAAVPMLARETGRQWHAVTQGVMAKRFYPLPNDREPTIAFSSYGRRWPVLHDALRQFCHKYRLHYDYTVAAGLQVGTDPRDNYEQLAWHLRQSWFTVGWPVELTNPKRVRTFSPITCRWFEAAASGAVLIGAPPTDPAFDTIFGPGFVEPIPPYAPIDELVRRLGDLWERRRDLRAARLHLHRDRCDEWTWESRVRGIRSLTGAAHTVIGS
jgi:hypothetical protein